MKEYFDSKVMPAVMKFVGSKGVTALRDGMVATMSLTIIGSVFLILGQLPWKPAADFIVNSGLQGPLMHTFAATFNILAAVAVFSIAYSYVKLHDLEALGAGVLSLVAFLVLIPHNVGEVVDVLPFAYLGSKGMIAAIIVGLLVGVVYVAVVKRGFTIKMPDGVPQGIADAFTALIPGTFILIGAFVVYGLTDTFLGANVIDIIYDVIQTPLSGLTGSFWGVVAIGFLVPLLWWFGIHGNTIIGGVMGGIWTANMLENQALFDAGKLTIADGGHVATTQFNALLVTATGSGFTIGIVLAMLFFAKSEQFKQLGKLAIGPGLFNINEPVLFGTPIVMNPFMVIPFIGVPVVVSIVAYFAISTGLVPLFTGINPPWTTPPIISGLLAAGWKMAALQAVLIVISIVGYTPFIIKMDKMNLEAERLAQLED